MEVCARATGDGVDEGESLGCGDRNDALSASDRLERGGRQAMYVERVHIADYGPIEKLDIKPLVKAMLPKPVVLVGENGSGKSIVLSHIVNGLVAAKGVAYPLTPEVEAERVYKLRSSSYIRTGGEFSYSRIEFQDGFFVEEIRLMWTKQESMNESLQAASQEIQGAWRKIQSNGIDNFESNFHSSENRIRDVFRANCILYFPHNRFEEPAWLNKDNLNNRARYTELSRIEGETTRKVINYSPLRDNQNWLFDVIYDSNALEVQTLALTGTPFNVSGGYQGSASQFYQFVLNLVRLITGNRADQLRIGRRHNRTVSLHQEERLVIPNIFQMSSGELALLNLVLSILRDYDLSGASASSLEEIRGVVVVDEVDLHLHSIHQSAILPQLIRLFPKIQFIITTHSPLFVLGMSQTFGDGGFGLYRMPTGEQIGPEEFSEFHGAYRALSNTLKFKMDMQEAIERSQKPIVFVEGITDMRYLQRAGELLGRQTLLDSVELKDGDGAGNLVSIWKATKMLSDSIMHRKIVLVFDPDTNEEPSERGTIFKRIIPVFDGNPVKKGIENLFEKRTLSKAIEDKPAFIDIENAHSKLERGQASKVPEKWSVNKDEKSNLCNWLCEHGTRGDFRHFEKIFEILEEALRAE